MSTDFERMLREAAGGPAPPLDVAEVRRRGRRRRRAVGAASAACAGTLAGVVALGLAFVPDLGPTVPVIEPPGVVASPEQPPPAELPDPWFSIADEEGGCALQWIEDDEVVLRAPLDEVRAAVLCADSASTEAVRRLPPILFQATQTAESAGPETASGAVDGTVRTIELVLHDGSRFDGPTYRVETPGDVDLAGFAIELPTRAEWLDIPLVERVVGRDHQGAVVLDVELDPDVHEPLWERRPMIDTMLAEPFPAGPSSAVPVDDLPLAVPDLPLVGSWRPERSPVDLTPLSFRGGPSQWHLDRWHVDEHDGPVGAEEIGDRLGSAERLTQLCAFLDEQIALAMGEADEADAGSADLRQVGEEVVLLVTRQETILGGDQFVRPISRACGITSTQHWGGTPPLR